MQGIVLKQSFNYNGSQINSLWGYMKTDVQDDSIIAFRGECDVQVIHMIDLEDKKDEDNIYSPDMLHFIIEHFDSIDIKLIYARQRFFTCIVAEVLAHKNIITSRIGDDLFIEGKKLSVSIASVSPVSAKIHFGLNVEHGIYGNLSTLSEEELYPLMKEIVDKYVTEIEDIEKDLRKSRPLGVI